MIKVGPDHLNLFSYYDTIKDLLTSCSPSPSNNNFYLNCFSYNPSPCQNLQRNIAMQASEVTELRYLVPGNPTHFSLSQNTTPTYQSNTLSNPLFHLHVTPQVQELNPQSTYFGSSNSTSDEADEQQLSLINERKQRRMISNRESARRSRMRKQKHLDELWSHVVWLRNENHQLVDKLNNFSETHDRVLQENAQLKEETSELRQVITDMQLNSTYPTLRDLDDIRCNTAYLRTESSNQSITSSSDLLP